MGGREAAVTDKVSVFTKLITKMLPSSDIMKCPSLVCGKKRMKNSLVCLTHRLFTPDSL